MAQEIDRELLSILVCPLNKLPLVQDGDWLVCHKSAPKRRYPVRDSIPVMLIDESEVQNEAGEWVKPNADVAKDN